MLGERRYCSSPVHYRLDDLLELPGMPGFIESTPCENHSGDSIVLQDTQIVKLLARVAVRIADNREVTSLVGHVFYPTHNLCKIRIGIRADQHRNEITALRTQTAGQRVGDIVQLCRRLHYLLSGLIAYRIRGAAQFTAGTGHRDART